MRSGADTIRYVHLHVAIMIMPSISGGCLPTCKADGKLLKLARLIAKRNVSQMTLHCQRKEDLDQLDNSHKARH